MIEPRLPCIAGLEKLPRRLSKQGRHDAASVASVKSKMAGVTVRMAGFRADGGNEKQGAFLAGRISLPNEMQAAVTHGPIQMRMNAVILPGRSLIICMLLFLAPLGLAQQKTTKETDYRKEELGVNPYTAPSVADIFQQLDDLKPLPFEELKREFPQAMHSGREQTGMVFGGLVADGFLITACQKKDL